VWLENDVRVNQDWRNKMKFKKGERVVSLDTEKTYEVAEDTTDDNEFVKILAQYRRGSTIHWVEALAPMNRLINITQTGETK
jgi:hypothetical protein